MREQLLIFCVIEISQFLITQKHSVRIAEAQSFLYETSLFVASHMQDGFFIYMKRRMDKGIILYKNRRIISYGMILILVIIINVVGINSLFRRNSYIQSKIESLLPGKKEVQESENIRVLLKTNGFKHLTHSQVQLKAESGLVLTSNGIEKEYAASELVLISPSDQLFQNGTIQVKCKDDADKICIVSLQRGYGNPVYRGSLELFSTAEGIVIVNELPMEEYLYAVVPSEMPASYEIEALKAQAVCARSYAYNQSRKYSYPEYQAHVDDSTSFQVYGNSKEQSSTIRAVDETSGEKIWYNGRVATAYYYSTSSGQSASIQAWGTKYNDNNRYLKSIAVCDEKGKPYEKELPWYRWTTVIPQETLGNLIELNTGTELGTLKLLSVTQQGDGGIVQQITAIGDSGKVVVETENKIRRALGGNGYTIEKQDGTVVNSSQLLPSAFFTIKNDGKNYVISGGGYGHGIGMSQNGANEMAKAGKNYREILTTFYSGVTIQ